MSHVKPDYFNGVCSNCRKKTLVTELGMIDYREGERPHLCYDCREEWGKFYYKKRVEINKHFDWREFFEYWLSLNPTLPEVVEFT